MLDQNTDRMWFVIGALIVGAGIILLANKTMPEIFASVTETFEDSAIEATHVIDRMSFNLINISEVKKNKGYFVYTSGEMSSDNTSAAHYVSNYMEINEKLEYVFRTDGTSHNTRIVYYDVNKNYISNSYEVHAGSFSEVKFTPVKGARYARISGGISAQYVDSWYFGILN